LKKIEDRLLKGELKNCRELFTALRVVMIDLYDHDPEGLQVFQVYPQKHIMPGVSSSTINEIRELRKSYYQLTQKILEEAQQMGLIKNNVDSTQICDLCDSVFIGLVQLERSRMRNKDDFFQATMNYGFSLIAESISF